MKMSTDRPVMAILRQQPGNASEASLKGKPAQGAEILVLKGD
jgi:hypothetical protein